MKKIFSLVCIGLGLLSLTSCKEQQQKIQYTEMQIPGYKLCPSTHQSHLPPWKRSFWSPLVH